MSENAMDGLGNRFGSPRLQIAMLLVILVGAGIRISSLGGVTMRSPDERIYSWEASVIAQNGEAGFASLVTRFERDPSLFAYPSPIRAGYLSLLSWTLRVTGNHAVPGGAILSCTADILSLLLLGLLACRLLSPRIALLAMLFYAVSPPVLMMARRAWQEAVVECLGLILLTLSLQALRSARPVPWIAAVACAAALSVTVKEVAMIDAALLWLLLAASFLQRRAWASLATLAGFTTCASLVFCAWLAHLVGGFSQWISFLHQNIRLAGTTDYAVQYASGSPLAWLYCVWVADPVILTLGGLGICYTIGTIRQSRESKRTPLLLWSVVIVAAFLALPMILPHLCNLRFVCPVFAPLCLLAGAGTGALAGAIRASVSPTEYAWGRRFAMAVLLVAALINYRSFQERFVHTDLQDLSLKMVLTSPEQS